MGIDDETTLSAVDTRWSGTYRDRNRNKGGKPTYEVLLAPSGVILELHGQEAKAAAVLLAPDVEPTVSRTELARGMGTDIQRLTSAVRNVAYFAPRVGVEIRVDTATDVYKIVPITIPDVSQSEHSSPDRNGQHSLIGHTLHHFHVGRDGLSPDPRDYKGLRGVNRTRHVTRGPRGGTIQRNIRKW